MGALEPRIVERGLASAVVIDTVVAKYCDHLPLYWQAAMLRPVSEVNVNAAGPGGGNAGAPLFQKFGNANKLNETAGSTP